MSNQPHVMEVSSFEFRVSGFSPKRATQDAKLITNHQPPITDHLAFAPLREVKGVAA